MHSKFIDRVYAVPGPITSSLSKGPHSLIGKGAKLISGAEEIIRELGGAVSSPPSLKLRRVKGDTEDEQVIIDLLQNESMHFDELVKLIMHDSSKLGSILSLMEMKGMIKSLGGGVFCLGG
jgi:DNA processing protein